MCETVDYSDTVYYGSQKSPPHETFDQDIAFKPQVTTLMFQQIEPGGGVIVDLHTSPLDASLASSEVYRKHSPQPAPPTKSHNELHDTSDSATTFGSQNTASTKLGAIRLELKGGTASTESPRLRGGDGHQRSSIYTSFSFKLKRWLLTCHGPCPDDFDLDSDAGLPPNRVVAPDRVAMMREKMNGNVPLPSHLSRNTQPVGLVRDARLEMVDTLPQTTFTTTISGPLKPKRSLFSRFSALSFPRSCAQLDRSHIDKASPTIKSQDLTPSFPHLRGGAGSQQRTPPTLFWLAGGTGRKSISFSGWKKSRPKQRMGGLFGMAVFGDRHGQDYETPTSSGAGVEDDCSSSAKVTVESMVAAEEEEVKGCTDASKPESKSSSRSSVAAETESVEETAKDAASTKSVGQALSPPLDQTANEVPMCSGALPVETVAQSPADGKEAYLLASDGK